MGCGCRTGLNVLGDPRRARFIRAVLLAALGVVLGGSCLLPVSRLWEVKQMRSRWRRSEFAEGHPWRPPFGLQRVGRPLMATVEISTPPASTTEYTLVARRGGQELSRCVLNLTGQSPSTCQVSLNPWPTEIVLVAKPAQGAAVELARQTVRTAGL